MSTFGVAVAIRALYRSPMLVTLTSVLTCPACGHAETLAMPTDACLFFHECAGCHTLLRPKAGDCCVFCSYGSVPCPPIQGGARDAGNAAGCCGARPAPQDASA
jgi:hypothetical protein